MSNGKFSASNKAFRDKYRDKRWEDFQWEVKNRAGNACADCGSRTYKLRAHHHAYGYGGRDPWDYPVENFTCLCDTCHEKWDVLRAALRDELIAVPLQDQHRLIGYIRAVKNSAHGGVTVPENEAQTQGMADFHGFTLVEMLSVVDWPAPELDEEPPF